MWILTDLFALGSVADARCPFQFVRPSRLVAGGQSRGEGCGMVGWGPPDVADSVTDRCVEREGPVAEDTFHRGNEDGMDSAGALWSSDGV